MRAIKVLDHALLHADPLKQDLQGKTTNEQDIQETTEEQETNHSEYFIQVLGLKCLCSCLMQKNMKKYKKVYSEFSPKDDQEHVISIFYSLFKSVKKQEFMTRLYYKFIENDYEKLERLVATFDQCQQRALEVEQTILSNNRASKRNDSELDYMDRLDGGLFTLQLVAILLAHLAQEASLKAKIIHFLDRYIYNMETVSLIIQEYLENLGPQGLREKGVSLLLTGLN